MWPFENSLRNQLRNQDLMKKYREWLKKWLLKGNGKFNAAARISAVLVIALLSAYGIYNWQNDRTVKDAVTGSNTNQVIKEDYQKTPTTQEQNNTKTAIPKVKNATTVTQPNVNPEEMVKPVMGHVLTGVGMTFSEVFKDYRYNTGVALAGDQGTEIKTALAGTVSGISTAENNTMVVTLRHDNNWESSYSGLENVQVQTGQQLDKNQILGTLGKNSRTNGVLENHLYFQITKNGEPVDPNIYWK
ncbi:M23 family metallopeptidase [Desulfotomaculum sp. 1211_IL3151]|uniref:M23 family metallopeptidase n=1 Tax=Desulfotomaculum sp. 1211_IL3151 TaxID=3084055 RepID=UPI002FDB7D36